MATDPKPEPEWRRRARLRRALREAREAEELRQAQEVPIPWIVTIERERHPE